MILKFKYFASSLAIDNIAKLISLSCGAVIFIKITKFNAPIPHERGARMRQVVLVGPDF